MVCSNIHRILIIILFLTSSMACKKAAHEGNIGVEDKIKYRQYMANGQKLYLIHCGNCHQDDGTGLSRLYPPLKDSDFLREDLQRALCIIRYGMKGEIIVNNVSYNMDMPENPELTNLEFAEISTYVLSTFADQPMLITPDRIEKLESGCGQAK